jgi:class 3 adenylate cyclase
MTETTTVTVLFTDVVGSTGLRTGRGDTAAHEIMSTHNELVRHQIEQHAGHEVKTIGDSFMVAFDSARRAVECAIAVQRSLADHNRRHPDEPVVVRIGLHTGEAISEGGDLFGSSVDAAARIMSHAAGEQILVSEVLKAVMGAAREIQFLDRGRFRLKGFPDRWHLFEVAWRQDEPAAAAVEFGRTPYVGRPEERERLRKLLEGAQRGRSAIVLLGGEAGVGKTRLAEEVVNEARARGMFTTSGRCYDMKGAPPYIPFVEAIEYSLRVSTPENFRAALGDAAPEIARIVPRIRSVYPDLPPPIDLPPEQAQHLMFENICDFFERAAKLQPIVLVLDDLHWAEESTALLLEHVAQRLENAPLLLIGTYRDIEVDHTSAFARSLQRLARKSTVHRISLRRLGKAEVGEIIARLSGRVPPDPLIDVIYRETEGVPFFVEEVYRHLSEERRLVDDAGHWRPDVSIGEVEVPESVRMVLGQRLDRVADDVLRVLTLAAVIGKAFTYEFLRALATESEDALLDAIDEAERAHLIVATEGRDPHFTFAHEQIRQTLLGRISFPRRQRFHLRVADAIEQTFAHELEEHVADLAFHLQQGGAGDRAREYLIRAGDAAAARFANAEALEAYGRAIELAGAGPERRRALMQRARLLLGLFRGKEAAGDLEDAAQQAREAGEPAEEVEALIGLGNAYYFVALDDATAIDKSKAALERAYELAVDLGNRAAQARALIPTHRFVDYEPEYRAAAIENVARAEALAEQLGEQSLVIEARRAMLRFLPGAEAEVRLQPIWKALEDRNDLVALNEHAFYSMWTYLRRLRLEECVACCDEGFRLARRIGAEPVQYGTIKALALIELGRFGDAWEALESEIADEAHPFGRTFREMGEAVYFLESGDYAQAAAKAQKVIPQAEALGRAWMIPWARTVLAGALLQGGSAGGQNGEDTLQAAEDVGLPGARRPSVDALLAQGAAEEALRFCDEAIAASARSGATRDRLPMMERRARALLLLGRAAEALETCESALAEAEPANARLMTWRLQAARAGALARIGDNDGSSAAKARAASVVNEVARTIANAAARKRFLAQPAAREVLGNAAQS